MKAVLGGIKLADSDEMLKIEGNHYSPLDNVSWQHLELSRSRSVCSWKGVASYCDIADGERVAGRRPGPTSDRCRRFASCAATLRSEARSPSVSTWPDP